MVALTLLRQNNPLAQATCQLKLLEPDGAQKRFEQSLAECGLVPLQATGIEILQINVGKLCNQTCRHCHVDAGPDRRDIMTRETMQACVSKSWPRYPVI